MTDRHQARRTGLRGETVAVWWLRLKGYTIVARGYTIGRGTGAGEIDIIARRGPVVAMVEVKARRAADDAALALRRPQRERIGRAARQWLARHPDYNGHVLRFDVMLVAPWRWPRHIVNAWEE